MMSRWGFIAGAILAVFIPFYAHAQQTGKIPRIGVLWHAGSAEEEHPYFESLIEGFKGLGYGKDRITLVHRFPNEKPKLYNAMAAELVASKPDVLVAVGGAAPYLKRATNDIPMIFMYVPDPVGSKLVDSVARPGGNATGLTNFSLTLSAKRLEFLKVVVPSLSRVALLINPNAKISELYIKQSKDAEAKLGITTHPFPVRSLDGLDAAFDAMAKAGMQAVVVNASSLFYQGKVKIGELAIEHKLPTIVWVREVLEAGSLISYGADQLGIARRVAFYVDQVLRGKKPADMPVEQPERFELIFNAKTAKALGIKIPQTLLYRADDIVN
ncbi:MAG: ABC transporter substrate-binding protein [Rhodospirillaceae bacterium]|jgi:putative tryptophan/tyrosine transport system substrate-binding protein|nr:ABC transporter substrate-binding protein [Rhodospirillaceae bacterium]MBT3886073.1 ABC transporter substrate-binding protein [Rhodospirillaceae bacterium]MBT4115239.1 ABC transporter substrate-binding protein [Rhodospirillaceae bacterium]MBT4673173.1 ABC transporter substrate-binding protein [Rhodospirillaceae bacterium]MBT4719131.1 ABC transporter substrate-binding protein [Rhodospirillaceae bacterium]